MPVGLRTAAVRQRFGLSSQNSCLDRRTQHRLDRRLQTAELLTSKIKEPSSWFCSPLDPNGIVSPGFAVSWNQTNPNLVLTFVSTSQTTSKGLLSCLGFCPGPPGPAGAGASQVCSLNSA